MLRLGQRLANLQVTNWRHLGPSTATASWRTATPGRLAAWLAAVCTGLVLAACAVNAPNLPPPDTTGSLPTSQSAAKSAGLSTPATTRPGKAKVVMLLPLSGQGQLGAVAKAMKQAGELALFDRNAAEFDLVVKDDKGTPEGARAAAEEAVREGAEVILGPLLSASVEAAIPVAAEARIPLVAFSNDRRLMRPGVYLLSFMPDQDVERIVAYALASGRRNFAALLPDDAYGQIVEETFKKVIGSVQGNIVAIERYSRGGAGTLEATRRLGEALSGAGTSGDGSTVADALLLPGEPETLTSIGPLIAYARIDTTRVKLLGTAGWESPNLGRDPTFVGGWYPAPDQKGWQTFQERFAKAFGTTPPRIAALAFDGVGVALALSGASPQDRFTPSGFTRASGFQGADGTIRFQSDGAVVRALGIYEVQSVGARVVEPAAAAAPAVPATSLPRSAGRPAQLN